MIDRKQKLSAHFTLGELMPQDCDFIPPWIEGELTDLCIELLEPVRQHFKVAVIIHDAYRPVEHNSRVGGVESSDHLNGKAADFHLAGSFDEPWDRMTLKAFEWMREGLSGRYGQLILEDHRKSLEDSGKLWIHVSTPSGKHPGTGHDANAILVSLVPKKYMPYSEYAILEPQSGEWA